MWNWTRTFDKIYMKQFISNLKLKHVQLQSGTFYSMYIYFLQNLNLIYRFWEMETYTFVHCWLENINRFFIQEYFGYDENKKVRIKDMVYNEIFIYLYLLQEGGYRKLLVFILSSFSDICSTLTHSLVFLPQFGLNK